MYLTSSEQFLEPELKPHWFDARCEQLIKDANFYFWMYQLASAVNKILQVRETVKEWKCYFPAVSGITGNSMYEVPSDLRAWRDAQVLIYLFFFFSWASAFKITSYDWLLFVDWLSIIQQWSAGVRVRPMLHAPSRAEFFFFLICGLILVF